MANVPVNDITPIHQYIATANQTDFVFTYVIYETSDIQVFLNDVLKIEVTDYQLKKSNGAAVTGTDLADGLSGGKVVFNSGLALNDNVTLYRDIPIERTTGFAVSGVLSASAFNLAFNKLIAMLQQVERDGARTIRQAPSDTGASPIELPSLDARKGKYMFFNNETGVPEAGPGASVGDYAVSEFGQALIDDADAATALTTLGVSAFIKTLLDDADAATARATLGVLLPEQITIANGTDSDHDINFTAGNFDFDDQSGQATLSAITKQIDAPWAEGTNAGGLDTGTVAADTFYYLFAIYNPTTQTSDALFSASKTSPTLPSGYTKKKYVGCVLTNGSDNLVGFRQIGNLFRYTSLVVDLYVQTPSTTGALATITVPPIDNIVADLTLTLRETSHNLKIMLLVTNPNETNDAPSDTGKYHLALNTQSGDRYQATSRLVSTSSLGQVRYRVNTTDANTYLGLMTNGYFDYNL